MKKYTFIFIIFSILGVIYLNMIIHEESHYLDYSEINQNFTNQEICVYEIPTNITFKNIINSGGYYEFYAPIEEQKAVEKIDKYTELKAYSINILFSLLFGFLFIKFLEENNYA